MVSGGIGCGGVGGPGSEEGEGAGQWCSGRELKAGLRSAAGKVGVPVAGERGGRSVCGRKIAGPGLPLGEAGSADNGRVEGADEGNRLANRKKTFDKNTYFRDIKQGWPENIVIFLHSGARRVFGQAG